MIRLLRTDSKNTDFTQLVNQLNADLAIRDGDEHSFYSQYNKIEHIKFVVLAYENHKAIGCGAIKEYSSDTMEIKRMYVPPEGRKKEIATKILTELESWASELSYTKCILETGKRQPEAIALYKKNGYKPITNYGQYTGIENSLCFEKEVERSKT